MDNKTLKSIESILATISKQIVCIFCIVFFKLNMIKVSRYDISTFRCLISMLSNFFAICTCIPRTRKQTLQIIQDFFCTKEKDKCLDGTIFCNGIKTILQGIQEIEILFRSMSRTHIVTHSVRHIHIPHRLKHSTAGTASPQYL